MTENNNPHYVTPEEADKMKCPMKITATIRYAKCHGPECLAWRWVWHLEENPETKKVGDIYSTTHGYCGMVGS